MSTTSVQQAAAAFSAQAPLFDDLYDTDRIVAWKRGRVRRHVLRWIERESYVLELNCGTGTDALWLAGQGHQVLATDVSEAMLVAAEEKRKTSPVGANVRFRHCSYLELHNLNTKADFIFSNFGGLNCTADLGEVLHQCDLLLRPGGVVTLVVMPPFCLWESLFLLKGEWRTAMRRWRSSKGAPAVVEGKNFRCWYYRPRFIQDLLGAGYETLSVEGLCTLVPPSYRVHFPDRFPRLYRWLQRAEERWSAWWPWRGVGDYFIISVRKKPLPQRRG